MMVLKKTSHHRGNIIVHREVTVRELRMTGASKMIIEQIE